MKPINLRCQYLRDPIGIDAAKPRLSWILEGEEADIARGVRQQACQVLVASSMVLLEQDHSDRWDSERAASDGIPQVQYQGVALRTHEQCFWKVRVWPDLSGDEGGQSDSPSAWSASAKWSMGILEPSDWKASWIEVLFELTPDMPPSMIPASQFRREFSIGGSVDHAFLSVSALGIYEVRINGKRVGSHALAPEWTDYDQRVQYQTYDVTGLLRPGPNTIHATVTEGWYAGRIGFWKEQGHYGSFRPRFMAQLDIRDTGGGNTCVATDADWQGNIDGAIRFASLLDGQIVDARIGTADIVAGSECEDAVWKPVSTVPELDSIQRAAQINEPIAVIEERSPVSIRQSPSGATIVDLGQNMVGWCRIRLREEPGKIVNLRHAEVVDEKGELYTAPLRCALYKGSPGPHHGIYGWMGGARQMDTYICSGTGEEAFEPRFTQHGFRYVEVTGAKNQPKAEDITGCVVSSSVERAGWFECSDPAITCLMEAIRWTQIGNLQGLPIDCPQRDERLGWLGDAQVFAQAACFNSDMAAFYTKFLQDVRDAQSENGRFPDFAPNPLGKKRAIGAPGWSDGGLIIPWVHYLNYADEALLEEHYSAARRQIESVATTNPDHLWINDTGNNYGDHLNGDHVKQDHWTTGQSAISKDVFATAFYANSVRLLAKIAGVLGHKDHAERYHRHANAIRAAFQNAFVDEAGLIKGDTQGGYTLALHFDLLAKEQRELAVNHLLRRIEERGGYQDTGIQTTNRMMMELTREGHVETAYQILNNDRIPSWKYMIEHGATTIWERWDSWSDTKGFQDPSMNSFNHYAMGAVAEWIYRTIGGINPDPEAPGFEHFLIRPKAGGGISWARTTHTCIRGTIRVEWKTDGEAFHLDVTVPPNTSATIYIPCEINASVRESGHPLDEAKGITRWERTGDTIIARVGSGHYRFHTEDEIE
jgi:alpha-L-rhamnosidase